MKSLRSTKEHTPKLYFQFWSFQFFILGYGVYFMHQNHVQDLARIMIILIALLGSSTLIGTIYLCCYDIYSVNTPTHCCTGPIRKCCHYILEFISMVSCFSLILFIVVVAPTIILVYFLYPTRTLVRLPFIISAIIYINSLAALLLFQCERAFYSWSDDDNHDGDDDNHDDEVNDFKYDDAVKKESKYHKRFYYKKIINNSKLYKCFYTIVPIIIFILLVILIVGVVILSELAFDHSNNFKDNQLQTLIALLPTFLLFFGSLYRRDLFIVDHKDEIEAKSEKEFLHELLQESRKEKEFLHEILQDLRKEKSSTDTSQHNTGSNTSSNLERSPEMRPMGEDTPLLRPND